MTGPVALAGASAWSPGWSGRLNAWPARRRYLAGGMHTSSLAYYSFHLLETTGLNNLQRDHFVMSVSMILHRPPREMIYPWKKISHRRHASETQSKVHHQEYQYLHMACHDKRCRCLPRATRQDLTSFYFGIMNAI